MFTNPPSHKTRTRVMTSCHRSSVKQWSSGWLGTPFLCHRVQSPHIYTFHLRVDIMAIINIFHLITNTDSVLQSGSKLSLQSGLQLPIVTPSTVPQSPSVFDECSPFLKAQPNLLKPNLISSEKHWSRITGICSMTSPPPNHQTVLNSGN